MSYSRADYQKMVADTARAKFDDRQLSSALHLIHAAAPLEKLTQSDEWNRYLQLVTGLIAQTQEQERLFTQQLKGALVKHEDLLLVKLNLAAAEARIQALQQVLELPKTILEASERVKGSVE